MDDLEVQEQDQRAEVLDRERDADIEPRDRREVEGVDAGESDDAEDREQSEVLPADLWSPADRDCRGERGERADRSELRQSGGGHVVVEQETGEGAVQCPEGGGRCRERVAELGVTPWWIDWGSLAGVCGGFSSGDPGSQECE